MVHDETREQTMKKQIVLAALAAATLVAGSSFAQAADGCGRGFYWNGYRCAPMRYYGPPAVEYRAYRGPYRTFNGCPRGYTIQDGVCKPYRGY
jgi:hypothetical protein